MKFKNHVEKADKKMQCVNRKHQMNAALYVTFSV